MSDLQAESNVITSQKPIPRIKDISMMKAWKDSKVRFGTLLNRSITEMEPVPVTGGTKVGLSPHGRKFLAPPLRPVRSHRWLIVKKLIF
jgi:hypothetical protein